MAKVARALGYVPPVIRGGTYLLRKGVVTLFGASVAFGKFSFKVAKPLFEKKYPDSEIREGDPRG